MEQNNSFAKHYILNDMGSEIFIVAQMKPSKKNHSPTKPKTDRQNPQLAAL